MNWLFGYFDIAIVRMPPIVDSGGANGAPAVGSFRKPFSLERKALVLTPGEYLSGRL